MGRLTNKQEAFIEALIQGKSQREAYKAAYDTTRMKDETIDVKASELVRNGKVSVRFEELQAMVREEAARRSVASAAEVLEELTRMAMGTKAYPAYDMFGKEYAQKPSLTSRIKALELLGKHHRLFTEQVHLDGAMPVKIVDDVDG